MCHQPDEYFSLTLITQELARERATKCIQEKERVLEGYKSVTKMIPGCYGKLNKGGPQEVERGAQPRKGIIEDKHIQLCKMAYKSYHLQDT